ncbi:MAG: LysR family transcriptional regulator [Burkholderiales bacterium]|nr:LysR family transcriptional regulator [Burkholderiales bacterium]
MNVHQLRAVSEVVRQGFQVSRAAEALARAQPGVSRQIMEIEDELGVKIFRRSKNRIQDLTPAGREILPVLERILRDIGNLQTIGAEFRSQDAGRLVIATTHTHAHYSLPAVIEKFSHAFPDVKLALRQGNPVQCAEAVATGLADLSISTQVLPRLDGVVSIPSYRIVWDMVAAAKHPILRQRPITMKKISRYPLITHDSTFSGRQVIREAFASVEGAPFVALDGADADISKAYVERGLGIAILAKVAFDAKRDARLRLLHVEHLLTPSVLYISLRNDVYLRRFLLEFISMYASHISPEVVRQAVAGRLDAAVLARNAPVLK